MTVSELISPEVDDSVVAQVITLTPLDTKSVLITVIVGSGNQTVTPPPIGGETDE